MGGIGSGSYYRWGSKVTMEACKRIDIRYMRKHGLLKPITHGSLSWNRGGEPCGNIGFTAFDDRLQLNYRYRPNDSEEWQPVEQTIYYDRTPCHYGNSRLWFLCPHCHRRVAVLASIGSRFLCRHCGDFAYDSQNDHYVERLRCKRDKLANRIFEDFNGDYGCTKKKGMHQRTFHQLREQFLQLDDHYHQAFEQELIRLLAPLEARRSSPPNLKASRFTYRVNKFY